MMHHSMTTYYLGLDLGAESGRLMLGTLNRGRLSLNEIHRFANHPIQDGNQLLWDIPALFQELMIGLTKAGEGDYPISSISCDSWGVDYLLFDKKGGLVDPTFHYRDPRTAEVADKVLARLSWERLFDQTGVQYMPMNTVFQLAAEKPSRLKKASLMLPIGDGFNFLLSGVPRADQSLASTTQLYNPLTESWSTEIIDALSLPRDIFPQIVPCGTRLGPLRQDVLEQTGLKHEDVDDLEVIASCSHDTAAAVAGIPAEGGHWAFLSSGTWSLLGAESPVAFINSRCRELNFTNEVGYGGSIRLLKNILGLWILQECRREWAKADQEYDYSLLSHLAAASDPFLCLINPNDPRFLSPGDMLAKIKAFCKETGQMIPKKPGEFARCIMESLALQYRRTFKQLEAITGRRFETLHIVGGGAQNSVMNHFTANALQIPVVVGPTEATTIGNIMVQAMTLGHVDSLEEARVVIKNSFPIQTIQPREAAVWDEAADRFERFFEVVETE